MSSIRDLARHLNISIGTVSRALNGRADVNAETRRRVLEAARSLNYAPNQSGRSLRQGTTNMVAFILETSRKMPLADTIFMSVLDGMSQTATVVGGFAEDPVVRAFTEGEFGDTVVANDDTAHAETYYLFAARNRDETNWVPGGRYFDRLERRDAAWRIAVRTNVIEWSACSRPCRCRSPTCRTSTATAHRRGARPTRRISGR